LQGFLLQLDVAESVVAEADEPNTLVDFLDAEFLAGADAIIGQRRWPIIIVAEQAILDPGSAGDYSA
jgi:hypothetical protein